MVLQQRPRRWLESITRVRRQNNKNNNKIITVNHVSGFPYGSIAGDDSNTASPSSSAVTAAAAEAVALDVPFMDLSRGKFEGSMSASAIGTAAPGAQEGNGNGRKAVMGEPSTVIWRVAVSPHDARSKKS